MGVKIVQFAAIILTALALVPFGAHLLELHNKIGLDRDHYMTVQSIYRGWALLGVVLIGAALANFFLAILTRDHTAAAMCAALAAILILLGLGIFLRWTYAANQATSNWSVLPNDWRMLRAHWEYSHAANAVLTFIALCLTVGSVVFRSP
ncbi:hypothetical protein [Rhodopila sp.]|uniref:hypothetical protein n=1 Tax=Rhodopila sp. TaxID=2480087 RepID=UPI003D12AC2E